MCLSLNIHPFSRIWKLAPPCPGFNTLVALLHRSNAVTQLVFGIRQMHPWAKFRKKSFFVKTFMEQASFQRRGPDSAFTEKRKGSVLLVPATDDEPPERHPVHTGGQHSTLH